MELKTKVILNRFLRAFVAGAITSVSIISASDVSTWTEIGTTLNGLAVAATIGGINGVLMAVDKLIRWKEEV